MGMQRIAIRDSGCGKEKTKKNYNIKKKNVDSGDLATAYWFPTIDRKLQRVNKNSESFREFLLSRFII